MSLPRQKKFYFSASLASERSIATTALLAWSFCLLKAMDNGQGVKAVFMDFMKTFDGVWLDGLMYNLTAFGVELLFLAWLKNYLSGRFI